jgi:hypothetical protein
MNQRVNQAPREYEKVSVGKTMPTGSKVRGQDSSKVSHQIAHPDLKRLGHPQKRVKADPLLPALDFSNIDRVQAGFLRQFFLTQADLITIFPNGVSQYFKLSRTRHILLGEQGCAKLKTPNMGVFLSCNFSTMGIKPFEFSERLFQ